MNEVANSQMLKRIAERSTDLSNDVGINGAATALLRKRPAGEILLDRNPELITVHGDQERFVQDRDGRMRAITEGCSFSLETWTQGRRDWSDLQCISLRLVLDEIGAFERADPEVTN
jgi:hypothetical protein